MTTPRPGGARRFSELGRLLRARREEMGLSRQRVAELTGLSYPYVAQLEGGHRAPSSDAARQLAGVLKLSYDTLVELLEREKGVRTGERSGFLPNPEYGRAGLGVADAMAYAPPSSAEVRGSDDVERVVEAALALLEELPVQQRLEVVARLQARVVAALVAEEVRRATWREP